MENQVTSSCDCCYKPFEINDIFCKVCGYPLQGTKEEKDTHIVIRANKEIDINELNKKVSSARNSLFWIGGIIGVYALISYFIASDADEAFALLITNHSCRCLFVFWCLEQNQTYNCINFWFVLIPYCSNIKCGRFPNIHIFRDNC